MLLPIENARISLPRYWWSISGMNAMALGVFLFPLFRDSVPTHYILTAMGVVACIGLVTGMYFTFRSTFDSKDSLWGATYGLIVLGFLFSGGGSAGALVIAGRADLGWLAFFTNSFVLVLSLLGGMYREARALAFWESDAPDRWKQKLEKYIDYSNHQVSPLLTNDYPPAIGGNAIQSSLWIAAVGSANIPLLFEIYGGGRVNAIFLAAPVLTGVLAYVNLKTLGPGIVRLLLLRKLEKNIGRSFINADLEQIQELRRTFFLSRWLMKDYAPPSSSQYSRHRQNGRKIAIKFPFPRERTNSPENENNHH